MPVLNEKLKWLLEKPIAHRGLHSNNGKCPENSIKAFKRAIEYGFPIELDVRLSRDEKIIVFHDSSLERMTGVRKRISDCEYSEIRKYNLYDSDQKIPLLTEVLEIVNNRVPLLIEIKNEKYPGRLEKNLWEVLRDYEGQYAIQSFNPFTILWFKRKAPHLVCGILSCSFTEEDMVWVKKMILKNMYLNKFISPDFIAYNIHDMPNKRIIKFKEKGFIILGWTVKNKEEEKFARKYCDNIIFEGYMP